MPVVHSHSILRVFARGAQGGCLGQVRDCAETCSSRKGRTRSAVAVDRQSSLSHLGCVAALYI